MPSFAYPYYERFAKHRESPTSVPLNYFYCMVFVPISPCVIYRYRDLSPRVKRLFAVEKRPEVLLDTDWPNRRQSNDEAVCN